jgi:hypothetical protein
MAERAIEEFDDEDLSADLVMSVLAELPPEESLIWTGRPRSIRRIVVRTIPKALFGAFFITFTLCWMVGVSWGGLGERAKRRADPPFAPHNVAIAARVGLGMIPPGLYLLTWPLRTRSRLKRTGYALTDRRALIIEPSLLGQPRIRNYTSDKLRLMRLEEHENGTGDLVFECPSTWVGTSQTVGFLGIQDAREVEALIHEMLSPLGPARSDGPRPAAADPDPVMCLRKSYRLALSFRLLQFLFLAIGLLMACYILVNLGFFLAALVFEPKLFFARIPQLNHLDDPRVAASVVATAVTWLIVPAGFFYFALAFPIEITIGEDATVRFRSQLRTITIPIADIISISTLGWCDPNRFNAVVRHKGGKLTLVNQFDDFEDFLATLRELNPSVEIKGF